MKKLLLFTFIAILFSMCNSQKSDLEGCWLLTPDYSNNFAGLVFDFDNGKFQETMIEFDTAFQGNYTLIDNQLHFNDTTTYDILHLSKDSLVLLNDTFQLHFQKLATTYFTEKDKQHFENELRNNAWHIKFKDVQYTFYLDTIEGVKISTDAFYQKAIQFPSTLGYKFDDGTKDISPIFSSIRLHNGRIFLAGDFGGWFINILFQVTDIQNNEIKGKLITINHTEFIDASFIKSNEFTSTKKAVLKKQLLKKWQRTEQVYPTMEFLKDSISLYEIHGVRHDYYPKRIEFIEKSFEIEFSENDYQISIGDTIIRQGKHWDFTPDGEYIYLDDKSDYLNFIEYKFIGNKLKIGKMYAVTVTANLAYTDYFEMILE